MRAAPEPKFLHGDPATPAPAGVLLCNLGTPDAPTAPAVRRYLREFLSDPRVVEIPRIAWLPILHGIILRTRPSKSANKYASIWTSEGSPLLQWTIKQAKLLTGHLYGQGQPAAVRTAMRYGTPSIAHALDTMRQEGIRRVLILPAYPQYSAATTASAFDAVYAWAARCRHVPELRFVNSYHDEPAYIEAIARSVTDHWLREGRGPMLVMSFHGMPLRTLDLGDPYFCHCQKTGRLVAERLGLRAQEYRITFQSRFGRARWLEPYTQPTLRELARAKVERVDVICPGFAVDCLETLEEINIEARQAFLDAGGKTFHYIGCLNDRQDGIRALGQVAMRHLQGWPIAGPTAGDLAQQRQRAARRGAPNVAPPDSSLD